MSDEKKLKNEEITDEQANEAAGGFHMYYEFTCSGCGDKIIGFKPAYFQGKLYCPDCIANMTQQKEGPQGMIDF